MLAVLADLEGIEMAAEAVTPLMRSLCKHACRAPLHHVPMVMTIGVPSGLSLAALILQGMHGRQSTETLTTRRTSST